MATHCCSRAIHQKSVTAGDILATYRRMSQVAPNNVGLLRCQTGHLTRFPGLIQAPAYVRALPLQVHQQRNISQVLLFYTPIYVTLRHGQHAALKSTAYSLNN